MNSELNIVLDKLKGFSPRRGQPVALKIREAGKVLEFPIDADTGRVMASPGKDWNWVDGRPWLDIKRFLVKHRYKVEELSVAAS